MQHFLQMSLTGHKLKKSGAQCRKVKKARLSEERRSGSLMDSYLKRPSNEGKCVEDTLESGNSFEKQNFDKVEETSSSIEPSISTVDETCAINSEDNDQSTLDEEYELKGKICCFGYTDQHRQLEEGCSNSYSIDKSEDKCDYNPSNQAAFFVLSYNGGTQEHNVVPREETQHTALGTLIKEGAIDPADLVSLKLGVEDKDLAIKLSCCQPKQELLNERKTNFKGKNRCCTQWAFFHNRDSRRNWVSYSMSKMPSFVFLASCFLMQTFEVRTDIWHKDPAVQVMVSATGRNSTKPYGSTKCQRHILIQQWHKPSLSKTEASTYC